MTHTQFLLCLKVLRFPVWVHISLGWFSVGWLQWSDFTDFSEIDFPKAGLSSLETQSLGRLFDMMSNTHIILNLAWCFKNLPLSQVFTVWNHFKPKHSIRSIDQQVGAKECPWGLLRERRVSSRDSSLVHWCSLKIPRWKANSLQFSRLFNSDRLEQIQILVLMKF